MTEKFEGGPKGPEEPRDYSAEEMQKIHQLAIKVRDLIGWDLGSMCSESEEIQIVNDAKDAMKAIEEIFQIPKQRHWFDEKKEEEEPQIESQRLSGESFTRAQESLDKIGKIFGWDIESSCHDETDLNVVKVARQAFAELKESLK